MENDPEWKRIEQLGRDAKKQSQANARMLFGIFSVVLIAVILGIGCLPESWKGIAVPLVLIGATVVLVICGLSQTNSAFAERDEAMNAYFKQKEELRNSKD